MHVPVAAIARDEAVVLQAPDIVEPAGVPYTACDGPGRASDEVLVRQMDDSGLRHLLVRAFRSAYEQRHPSRLRPYLEAFGGVGLVWCALALLQQLAGLQAPGSPYLLVIVAVSLRWGLRVGLFASAASVLAEMLVLPAAPIVPTDRCPMPIAHLLIYAAVPLSVGVLASFYRRRVRAEHAAQQERDGAEYQRRMVGILAHDLKAPITAVRGYIELARRHSQQGQPARADLAMGVAIQQIDRLTAMITNLVEASRIEQEPLDLRAVALAPALERLATAFGSDTLRPLVIEGEDIERLAVRADLRWRWTAFWTTCFPMLSNIRRKAARFASPSGGFPPSVACGCALPTGALASRLTSGRRSSPPTIGAATNALPRAPASACILSRTRPQDGGDAHVCAEPGRRQRPPTGAAGNGPGCRPPPDRQGACGGSATTGSIRRATVGY